MSQSPSSKMANLMESLIFLLILLPVAVSTLDLSAVMHGQGDIIQYWRDEPTKVDESRSGANGTSPDSSSSLLHSALDPKRTSTKIWDGVKDPVDGKFVVPYVISAEYSPAERRVILGAMEAISNNTCLKFMPHGADSMVDYVDIFSPTNLAKGCSTRVGRQVGRNPLYLVSPDCISHGTVMHELLHKVGLWHEQSRYDRNYYVRIHYGRIGKDNWPQFREVKRTQSNTYGIEYDYNSIMHYSKLAGSADRSSMTIETIHPEYQDAIGGASDASPSDYRKVCSLYNCHECMGRAFVRTTNGDCPPPLVPLRRAECHDLTPENADDFESRCCQVKPVASLHSTPPPSLPAPFPTPRPTPTRPIPNRPILSDPCSNCEPSNICEGIDVALYPTLFNSSCCGHCGSAWLKQWCSRLIGPSLATWRDRGMCPTQLVSINRNGRRTKLIDCDSCAPNEACRLSDVVDYPNYFNSECCGACGVVWRWDWCENTLSARESRKWKARGLCPVSVKEARGYE